MRSGSPIVLTAAALLASLVTATPGTSATPAAGADRPATVTRQMTRLAEATRHLAPPPERTPDRPVPCRDGQAGPFPCRDVDLLGHLSLDDLGVSFVNDVWGWTDPRTEREYALVGATEGTVVVDVSDPTRPWVVGTLPSHSTRGLQSWRDVKIHDGHALVVGEFDDHGLQVLDLTRVRDVSPDDAPVTFEETSHYDRFGHAHNLAVDTDTGFAYVVGSDTCGRKDAGHHEGGGPHMIDLSDPATPTFAGCFGGHGYTHDAQCVVYHGPDVEHRGREICLDANEQTLSIVDVTDKAAPVGLANVGYEGVAYTHQGWLTPDHGTFLLGDEADETTFGHNTTTYIWDLDDLDDPTVLGTWIHPGTASTDHNLYTEGRWVYESNYTAGLRILDTTRIADGELSEVAWFDVYPEDDTVGFAGGTWSNYPWFARDDLVAVSSMDRGLFLLQPRLPEIPVTLPVP